MGSPSTIMLLVLAVSSVDDVNAWSSHVKLATVISQPSVLSNSIILPLRPHRINQSIRLAALPDQDDEGMMPSKKPRKTMECRGQENNNIGWLWMLSYWSIGGALGTPLGYLPKTIGPFTCAHAAAAAATVGVIPRFLSLYTTYGRSRNIIAPSIMAIINGICETMIYLAVYDLGAVVLDRNSLVSFLIGLLTFNCYSYFIRKKFWSPRAFPIHMKADNAPFVRKGLPEVTIMSVSWMALYALTHDIASVCILHGIFNFCTAWTMGMQLPFSGVV